MRSISKPGGSLLRSRSKSSSRPGLLRVSCDNRSLTPLADAFLSFREPLLNLRVERAATLRKCYHRKKKHVRSLSGTREVVNRRADSRFGVWNRAVYQEGRPQTGCG